MDNNIYEKLNKIQNLDDRIMLKKILQGLFYSLEQHTEERLNELEEKVFNEIKYNKEKYNVFTCIIKRENLDPTDEFFHPILQEDEKIQMYNTNEILDSINNKEEQSMFKVFFKCDYVIFKNIINNNIRLKGTIQTDKKVHEAYFKLEQNKQYQNKISRLYKNFINNNIPWTTINNPYINKIANVVLIECKDEINKDENIVKIDIDFEEYSKYIKYNMIPVWNIKEISLNNSGFPTPCKDKINYEYTISIEKEGENNGYLVDYEGNYINYVTFTNKSIRIVSTKKSDKYWNIWKIISNKELYKQNYEYQIISNEVNINFISKLSFQNSYLIKSKAELKRLINSFKVSKYLEFNDLKIENDHQIRVKETYDVNDFITDEIRNDNITKILILYFKTINKDNYLNRDILSFLVSEVQFLYPEYKCEGRLI